MSEKAAQIQAILFAKGEECSYKTLASYVALSEEDVKEKIAELKDALSGTGLTLLEEGNSVVLTTAPEVGELIAQIRKEDLSSNLGKAGLETLSIVLYKGPISRSEIDYIRGVNSTFIIRNLMVRGLIEKVVNPEDGRAFLYKPSMDLLAHLGLTNLKELPEYTDVQQELNQLLQEEPEKETHTEHES